MAAPGILASKRKAAADAVRDAMQLYGRTVAAAWLAGERLIAFKADLPHGGFGPWLASERIAERTAREFMRRRQHVSRDELNGIVSIRAALETVKAKRQRAAVLD
ncbi:MAG: hypothetical protein OXG35_13120, partial [Acidobacteria bacterium]|nr:hypothetical protein [Acidobacteriota bacterium]